MLPVIEALAGVGVPLSVDTVKPEVMRRAVAAGASVINDIAALQTPGALEAAAASDAAVCLMHMQGEPRTMQADPSYGDVVAEVRDFLAARVAAAQAAGIAAGRIIVDPGFGFGKRLAHNLALLRHLGQFADLGACVLAGRLASPCSARLPGEKSVSVTRRAWRRRSLLRGMGLESCACMTWQERRMPWPYGRPLTIRGKHGT